MTGDVPFSGSGRGLESPDFAREPAVSTEAPPVPPATHGHIIITLGFHLGALSATSCPHSHSRIQKTPCEMTACQSYELHCVSALDFK